ncbi:MAG: hypothetical protein E7311_04855 [Clostridiales bacterium]|nr:hypothetical protein [Clostridiales bacterium]
MKVDTKKIILFAKKYALLVLIVLISVAIGSLAYSVGIDVKNESNGTNDNLVNNIELKTVNNLGKITIDDIITKNKVILEKLEVQTEEIPYETIALGRSKEGTVKTLTAGKNGVKEITYKVRYEDDLETSRVEVSNEVTKEVVNKVVEYSGTTISRGGDTAERESTSANESAPVSGYTKVMDMKFTAYCLCKKCTGKSPGDKGYGVTASGYKITPGQNQKVIAVDPKVIPLGTKVYVQGVNGMSDYGYAIAADTGGAIKGNKIDIYVDQHGTTQWWTVGNAKVYIFE